MGEVIEFNGITTLPLPPSKVLEKAGEEDLEQVLVLGWDKDGGLYIATSDPSLPSVFYLLKCVDHYLMEASVTEV
jgi:hypothetical protein